MVKEIKEETIVIDGNHPLAGKDLIFDLEVISVQ
jgi:FKBP-type peptidyl-prolyl cis-trans isomerase SlpA